MRIGIYGGSFNPIHIGHAIIARCAVESGAVDALWLMVSPQNPLKETHLSATPKGGFLPGDVERLRMAEMVSRRIKGVETSAFEFGLPRPSYTIATLDALREKFPEHEFVLLIGADNWAVFERWRDHERLQTEYDILIYPRRGYDISTASLPPRVTLLEAPIIEVSSTMVRERAAAGLSIDFLVPDEVANYIIRNNLYRNSSN